MPIKRRLPKRRRAEAQLTCSTLRWLCRGRDYFLRECDPEILATLWERHRGELMAEWIEQFPGHRPWAFYEFDFIGDERREDCFRKEIDMPSTGGEVTVSGVHIRVTLANRWDGEHCCYMEREPVWLHRNGLLSDDEIEALKAAGISTEPDALDDCEGNNAD